MLKYDNFSLKLAFHLPLDLYGEAANGRQPFIATITYAGIPSDGPVSGTEDIPGGPYRILIPTELMQAKIQDLIGKGVFAALTLDTHDGTVRIGKFQDSWTKRVPGTEIEAICASGFLDWKTNKDIVAKVVERARSGELGFSYDMKNAPVRVDSFNGEAIAVLIDFEWRGATILYRQTAAYQYTDLAAKLSGSSTPSTPTSINPQLIIRSEVNPAARTSSTVGSAEEQKEIEVTKEEIQVIFAESLKPMTDAHVSINSKLTGIETRLTAVEAKQAPEKKDANQEVLAAMKAVQDRIVALEGGKTKDTPAGETMTIKDLAASIAEAVGSKISEALKEGLKDLKPAAPGTGKRTTFSAEAVQVIKRYSSFEGDEPTVENIQASIHAVNDNKALSKSQKETALTVLSGMKRDLLKEQMRGGAQ